MRTTLPVFALFFSACLQPAAPTDGGAGGGAAASTTFTVEQPMRVDATPDLSSYLEIYDDGIGRDELNFDLALGGQYPQVADVGVTFAYITRGCERGTQWGPETFLSLSEVNGNAASLSIVDGRLRVQLAHEGVVSAVVSGRVDELECERQGEVKTSVQTRHLVAIRVSELSKFSVSHVSQGIGCTGLPLVLAAHRATWLPWVQAHDAQGALFLPRNAPAPVKLTLRAPSELTAEETELGMRVRLPPGKTRVELDTPLPVEGVTAIFSVEPSQVTEALVELGVVRANYKASEWVPVSDGTDVRLWLLDKDNHLSVRSRFIETTEGTLCSSPGADWFSATSETPETCAPASGDEEDLQVAKVLAHGECRATVKLRDSNFSWPVRFTTN